LKGRGQNQRPRPTQPPDLIGDNVQFAGSEQYSARVDVIAKICCHQCTPESGEHGS
jgi:hypothetical protein